MANARDEQHRYGQHYTPREVARLLAAFAVRSTADLVFDPSCGDGRLLAEALNLKRELSNGSRRRQPTSAGIFGVERSEEAIEKARMTGACVAVADFFDVEPGSSLSKATILPREMDAIIGNPPYIRHEFIGSADKRRIEARLARDRSESPTLFWPDWSGRSDIYVYFFARSLRFLRNRGRLAFITASSWLDSGYGAALREWMLRNFRVIAVIESAAESFFDGASINTCITVLERESDAEARDENTVRFLRFNRTLKEILGKPGQGDSDATRRLASSIEVAEPESLGDSIRTRLIAQSELMSGTTRPRGRLDSSLSNQPQPSGEAASKQGWGKYLRADEIFFKIISYGNSRLRSLSGMASVRFGVKTGANKFFYVNDADAGIARSPASSGGRAGNGLRALREVASVRRGITTGANEFFYVQPRTSHKRRAASLGELVIEPRFLSPVVFSLKEIPGISLDRIDERRLLFNCSLKPEQLAGTHALEYIEKGERAGYHRRPTCRSREPWYSVVHAMKPAPLIFPSKVGERWLVALNRAKVFEDKKLYGIFPSRGVAAAVLAALLNSTWTRYYVEVTCRQMTGAQAIADIDVWVAGQIMLPDPRELSASMKKRLEAALASLAGRPVYSIFEEVKLPDRRRLDALTLEAIGFTDRSTREAALEQLYEAVLELVSRRRARSHS